MIQKVKDWLNPNKQFDVEEYFPGGKAARRLEDDSIWFVGDNIKFGAEEVFVGEIRRFEPDYIHVCIHYQYMGVVFRDLVQINKIHLFSRNKFIRKDYIA